MLSNIRLYSFFILLIFSVSCAVQVSPSGGPKDTTPPKVEKEVPENKTINFDRPDIRINFNEFVILKSPEEQIVISPPLEENPEYIVSGRALRINFRSSLKRNTTYTINFGNSITDNHEGNVLENLRYVFATGSNLDTNKIIGTVYNSFNTKPEKNIVVGLYDAESFYDSIIYKNKPEYFNKTKDNGSFSIENIPNKKFILVGFNDENKNLKYTKNEALLFYSTPLDPTDTLIKDNKYRLFNPDVYKTNRLIDTFCKEKGRFVFLVYKPTKISVIPNKKIRYYSQIKKGKNNVDSLYIISDDLKNDSVVLFHVNTPDSIYDIKILSKKKNKYPTFNVHGYPYLELNDTMKIYCSNPYKLIDTTRIIFKEDTILVKPFYIKDSVSELIKLFYPLKEKTRYSVTIKDSAFVDIFGQYSTKAHTEITTKTLKEYGSLNLKLLLNNSSELYIIQLINEDENFIYKELFITKNDENLFEYLLPGNYKIKIIRDSNKNRKWDNGDYFQKQNPEDVYYYPEVITLKAYWDLDQIIDLNSILNKN